MKCNSCNTVFCFKKANICKNPPNSTYGLFSLTLHWSFLTTACLQCGYHLAAAQMEPVPVLLTREKCNFPAHSLFSAAMSSLSFWFIPQLAFTSVPDTCEKFPKQHLLYFYSKSCVAVMTASVHPRVVKQTPSRWILFIFMILLSSFFFNLLSVFCCCYVESQFVYFRFMLEFISKSWEWW